MPRKCSVYGCTSNYDSGAKTTVFRFPADENEMQRWIKNLPNRNFVWTPDTVVCVKHWPAGYATRKVRGGAMVPTDPPTVFPGVAAACIPTPAPTARAYKSFSERNQLPDQLPQFIEQDAINFAACPSNLAAARDDVQCFLVGSELRILSVARNGPLSDFSIFVDTKTFEFQSYSGLRRVFVPFMRVSQVSKFSELHEIINYLRHYEESDSRALFCARQMELINENRYSASDIAVALQLREVGNVLYQRLRYFLKLPSLTLLRRITRSVNDVEDDEYLTALFSQLPE
jgi:hypothetical protein